MKTVPLHYALLKRVNENFCPYFFSTLQGPSLSNKFTETLPPFEGRRKPCLMHTTQFEEEATEAQCGVMYLNHEDYKTPLFAH